MRGLPDGGVALEFTGDEARVFAAVSPEGFDQIPASNKFMRMVVLWSGALGAAVHRGLTPDDEPIFILGDPRTYLEGG